MTRRTIVYLHSIELVEASWVVCDDEEVEKSIMRGHLSDLTAEDKQNELIVIVPAFDVLLTEVSLPTLNRQRLLQALPFALEEQLVDDVSELHFAIADHTPSSTVPVAIVAQKKMAEWTALFKQFHMTPAQLYSGTFLLPIVEKSWSAIILPEGSTVRQNAWQGFGSENVNFARLLELALDAAVKKPECIHIYSTLPTPLPLSLNSESHSIIINEVYLQEESWLETLPAWVNPSLSINLLQGKYAPKRKTSETKKIWKLAASAALIWICLAFFFQLISFFILHHQSSLIEKKIAHIYKNNFPEASSIVSPGERMQKKLFALEERTNTNYFLILLAKVGIQLSHAPSVQLKNLDYRDNQLTLDVAAHTFDDLDALTHTLTAEGLQVKQQNAAVTGEQVKASLLIQRGTA